MSLLVEVRWLGSCFFPFLRIFLPKHWVKVYLHHHNRIQTQKYMRGPLNQYVLGKLYREFSRQKYNEYKRQFPRMLDSKIVSDIIKMWDSMPMQKKEALRNKYEEEREEFQRQNDEDPKERYMMMRCEESSWNFESNQVKESKVGKNKIITKSIPGKKWFKMNQIKGISHYESKQLWMKLSP